MSSHREAPEISKDPVADNTDTYAFISPDRPDTVTILTNYIPLEAAAAGPNFYEFGDDVLYSIHISNSGTGLPDITYEFRFETRVRNPNSFLYNTGPIGSLNDPNFNRRQFYSVTKVTGSRNTGPVVGGPHHGRARDAGPVSDVGGQRQVLATGLACPPCNVGVHSTPNYPALAAAAVYPLPGGGKVFAGQRNDGFFADLGAIFDLGDLRPVQNHFAFPPMLSAAGGIDTLKSGINVHTIAIQVPISALTSGGTVPRNPTPQPTIGFGGANPTIGIWGAASRRKVRLRGDEEGDGAEAGPFVQVSRLGNPLFNEVLVGQGRKDEWNRSQPLDDVNFLNGVIHPELAALLPTLYPGLFPNLAALNASGKPRLDIEAILLTGIPPGLIAGFQNFTSKAPADMLRLNVAIPPSSSPNPLGVLGGDLAGFPNGRRVADDIVTIEIRALAGLTYPLIDSTYMPDPAAKAVTQGVVTPPTGPPGTARFLPYFPYLGIPDDGFDTPPNPTPGPGTPGP
ncbi:MAG: DUF4331 domain-containing protein [Solirubrobacteraceae bacterium]